MMPNDKVLARAVAAEERADETKAFRDAIEAMVVAHDAMAPCPTEAQMRDFTAASNRVKSLHAAVELRAHARIRRSM